MSDAIRPPLSAHPMPLLAVSEAAGADGTTAVAGQSPSRHGWMSARDIRTAFIAFFEARQHLHVPSSSLVPVGDQSVLLTTAGMQQMTPYFLGLEQAPSQRMCSVQKCFRTVDIEEVGDESHCTFFFMLGNFSVGDYFKQDALRWSWEFLTGTMGLPADRLYPTIHPDDEQSMAIWTDEIGVPRQRIGILPDNWWPEVEGWVGPCGPDCEIYFDLGDAFDDGSGTGVGDNPRYLEVWNNVFMQFSQGPDGSRSLLPRQNVDTGMGLERLAMVMQGGRSLYDTDLYQPIIQRAAALTGRTYGANPEIDRSLRIIADHIRSGTFLISDGVLPGNEGRGYVLRRILRRAIRAGRRIGLERPFLAEMAAIVIDEFGADYPNLIERRRQIERVLTHEEESFGRTLNAGIARFQTLAEGLRERRQTTVPGEEAFRLYDTYGFPYDLTVELAREQGLTVDEPGFERAMETQRTTSRSGAAMFRDESRGRAELYVELAGGRRTEFLGYDPAQTSAEATILGLAGPDGALESAEAGQPIEIVLDRTPFYAESGGQVGDTGEIRTETGVVRIENTTKPAPDIFVHRGVVTEGHVRAGDMALATINADRRASIRRNHTATHLLHRALRAVLGTETHQAGSLVAPDRLRFDFTSIEPIRPDQVRRVADLANAEVLTDTPVVTDVTSYDEAVNRGAMALFGEKYGDVVRMVEIGDFSRELCGGTHVARTGEIGPIIITSEGSVASGVRRIEALTGAAALERIAGEQALLDSIAQDLRTSRDAVPQSVQALRDRTRELERELDHLRGELAGSQVDTLIDGAETTSPDGARMVVANVSVADRNSLRQLGDRLRDRIGSGVVVLGSVIDSQPAMIAMVTPDQVTAGVRAGDIIRGAAPAMDGRGGGRPDLAEAGGKRADRLDAALDSAREIVSRAFQEKG